MSIIDRPTSLDQIIDLDGRIIATVAPDGSAYYQDSEGSPSDLDEPRRYDDAPEPRPSDLDLDPAPSTPPSLPEWPRYEMRVAGRGDRPRDGYWCWDTREDAPVRWFRRASDAHGLAVDMNMEDALVDQPADDADLDARWCLTLAGGGAGLPMTDLDLPRRSMRVTAEDEARMYGGHPG